jgi:hypothetical protein
MNIVRGIGIPTLALAVVIGVSACQKQQSSTEMSMTDTTSMSAESPYPVEETPPAATNETHTATPPSKTTPPKKSSHSSSTTAAKTMQIPAGTVIEVAMVTPVATKTSNIGDPIEAKLTKALVVDGHLIAEEGATVRGTIADLQRASRSKSEEDRAYLKFKFSELETVGGDKKINATVTNSEGKLAAKGTGTRDKLIIGGSTVAGAVVGQVIGKDTKSTIIGAVGGAVVGTGVALSAKGHELEVPAGSSVTIRIDEPVTVATR